MIPMSVHSDSRRRDGAAATHVPLAPHLGCPACVVHDESSVHATHVPVATTHLAAASVGHPASEVHPVGGVDGTHVPPVHTGFPVCEAHDELAVHGTRFPSAEHLAAESVGHPASVIHSAAGATHAPSVLHFVCVE